MYCPQCSTESAPNLQYCRVCGANLKVIGKAVTLSEAIARSDRGPLPRLKELVHNFKLEQVSDEISGALEKMKEEIVRSSDEPRIKPWWPLRKTKSPERRREDQRVQGTVSLFTGLGLTIFLYNIAGALVLKLPPDVLAKIPFEIEPVVRVIWTIGLIPILSGAGHLVGSMYIKPVRTLDSELPADTPLYSGSSNAAPVAGISETVPRSVTEGTTHLLRDDQ